MHFIANAHPFHRPVARRRLVRRRVVHRPPAMLGDLGFGWKSISHAARNVVHTVARPVQQIARRVVKPVAKKIGKNIEYLNLITASRKLYQDNKTARKVMQAGAIATGAYIAPALVAKLVAPVVASRFMPHPSAPPDQGVTYDQAPADASPVYDTTGYDQGAQPAAYDPAASASDAAPIAPTDAVPDASQSFMDQREAVQAGAKPVRPPGPSIAAVAVPAAVAVGLWWLNKRRLI